MNFKFYNLESYLQNTLTKVELSTLNLSRPWRKCLYKSQNRPLYVSDLSRLWYLVYQTSNGKVNRTRMSVVLPEDHQCVE